MADPTTTKPCSVRTISRGVPAGANRPYHCTESKPGNPLSLMVGMSGAVATRFALVTPSMRKRPARACGSDSSGDGTTDSYDTSGDDSTDDSSDDSSTASSESTPYQWTVKLDGHDDVEELTDVYTDNLLEVEVSGLSPSAVQNTGYTAAYSCVRALVAKP